MFIVRLNKRLLLVACDPFALIFYLRLIRDFERGLRHENEFLPITTTWDPSENALGTCWLFPIALEEAFSKSICTLLCGAGGRNSQRASEICKFDTLSSGLLSWSTQCLRWHAEVKGRHIELK